VSEADDEAARGVDLDLPENNGNDDDDDKYGPVMK